MNFKAPYFLLLLSVISLQCIADTGFRIELNSYLLSGTSQNIEHIGTGLISELERRKPDFSSCKYEEFEKDAPKPIGDGKASNHIIFKCEGFSGLGIRYGFSPSGKYRIFGYWSVSS